MSNRVRFVEIVCEDGTRAWLRADEIGTILERKVKDGSRITLATKAKTLLTLHTPDDFWTALTAALGGVQTLTDKAAATPIPGVATPKAVKGGKEA